MSGYTYDEAVIDKAKGIIAEYRLTQHQVMIQSGVHSSVLSQYLQKKYRGDTKAVGDKLWKWVERVEEEGIESVLRAAGANTNTTHGHSLGKGGRSSREGSQHQQQQQQQLQQGLAEPTGRSTPPLPQPQETQHITQTSLKEQAWDARAFGGLPLIPVTISDKVGRKEFQDYVLWNVYERSLTPEVFVSGLARDKSLPAIVEARILASVRKQLVYWGFGKRLELPKEVVESDRGVGLVKLELSVRQGDLEYRDVVFWDPHDCRNNPEEFALGVCRDLGLTSDWSLRIAHQIRGKLLQHILAIYKRQPSPFVQVRPEELRSVFVPPSESLGLFKVDPLPESSE